MIINSLLGTLVDALCFFLSEERGGGGGRLLIFFNVQIGHLFEVGRLSNKYDKPIHH